MNIIPRLLFAEMCSRFAKTYAVSILLGLFAVLLAFSCNPAYCVGGLLLSAASAWRTRRHEQEVEACSRRAAMFEEQLDDCKKMSSVDELSGGIAHEINNPLAIIAQETQLIQHLFQSSALRDDREIEECKESIKIIEAQVDRCKEIVQKLLSLARHKEPVLQHVDVNKLIENIIMIFEKDAAARNIRIVKNLAQNLPVLLSDPPLLRQVILNIMINAAQAIEQSGTITVGTSLQDEFIEIVVKDTGCGISEEHLSKIFIPFFSTKPQGKGTGLGLAICRGMIEVLGGRIAVSSDLGKGTCFSVTLPIQRA
jgi:two-component system, NtrC family, sensor kinase